jgi:hypothetical protein
MANANRKGRVQPLCGDHVTVYLNLEEGIIKDISFKDLAALFQGFRVDDDRGIER